MENAEEYVELMFDFCMNTGIQKQMEAFRGKSTRHKKSQLLSFTRTTTSCLSLICTCTFHICLNFVLRLRNEAWSKQDFEKLCFLN